MTSLLTAGVLVGSTDSGSAAPAPTMAQVKARIAALDTRLDGAVEDYDQAQLQLRQASQQVTKAQQQVAVAEAAVARARTQISTIAAAAFRNQVGSTLATYVTGNPNDLVDRVATLDHLGHSTAEQLQAAASARRQLTAAEQQASAAEHSAAATAARLAARKKQIQTDLATQKKLFASMQQRERAALASSDQASAAAARALRARFAAGDISVGASGSAGTAVAWAYRELGKPYVWAGAGPNVFDCSGLTEYVWAKAGVSLPHSAAAQFGSGPHISQSQLQPGDLVFYGSPIHHVGIYIGGGEMIEAPHTGAVVRVASIDRPDYVGAARP